jgi:cytosine/creatinine deaminase
MGDCLFVNLRQADGQAIDIHCSDGVITAIAPSGQLQPSPAASRVECGNQLLLPALVESHVHLDKTLWGLKWRANTAGPRLADYIENERGIIKSIATPIGQRARALLEHCMARGSLYVRSHVDVAPDIGLKHVEAMLELREKYRDVAQLQFVAFPQTGMLIRPGTAGLMEEALKLGVETVGGLDPAGIDGDAQGHLRTIFDMAVKHGCGIDIHLHDRGELGLSQISLIADFTAAAGLAGKVMVSHAYCLGSAPEAEIEGLGRRLADLRISLMTSAPADTTVPPVEFLGKLGVNVCCGSDGIRDAWSPLGNGDMLERAFLVAYRFDWNKDWQLAAALACATTNGARALGLANYGIEVGKPADFIYLDAENTGDALALRPLSRSVVSRGRIVASGGKCLASGI